jgi:hypothetical protein
MKTMVNKPKKPIPFDEELDVLIFYLLLLALAEAFRQSALTSTDQANCSFIFLSTHTTLHPQTMSHNNEAKQIPKMKFFI